MEKLDLDRPLFDTSHSEREHSLVNKSRYNVITKLTNDDEVFFLWDVYGNSQEKNVSYSLINKPEKKVSDLVVGDVLISQGGTEFPISFINDRMILSDDEANTYVFDKNLKCVGIIIISRYQPQGGKLESSAFSTDKFTIKQ